MRTKTQEELIQLIRFEMTAAPLPEGFCVSDEPALIRLAKNHDLTHLIYDALTRNGLPCESDFAMQQYYASIWRAEQMGHEFTEIEKLFEGEGVDFIPLKGAVMRPMYPQSWMRTSADTDILVREQDDLRAVDLLVQKLGYVLGSHLVSHHKSLTAPSGMHLELHHALFQNTKMSDGAVAIAKEVWDRSVRAPGREHHRLMTDEMFYFFHIAHMAKHFSKAGGCAIRGLVDLWILDRIKDRNEAARKALLERAGLSVFGEQMSVLASAWMDDKEAPDEQIEQYIMSGYMYGSIQRTTAISVGEKGAGKYVMQRVFLPYRSLKENYPVLEKHKILTPVFEVVRWTRIFNKKYRSKLKNQTKAFIYNKQENTVEICRINERLGLKYSADPIDDQSSD